MADRLVAVMYPWDTQTMNPFPIVRLHAQFLTGDVRKTSSDRGINDACNVCLFCDVGSDQVKVATAVDSNVA